MQLPSRDPDTLFEELLQELPPEIAQRVQEFTAFVPAPGTPTAARYPQRFPAAPCLSPAARRSRSPKAPGQESSRRRACKAEGEPVAWGA